MSKGRMDRRRSKPLDLGGEGHRRLSGLERRPERKPESRSEGRSVKRAERGPDSRFETRSVRRAERRPDVRSESRPAQRPERKPERRSESRPYRRPEYKYPRRPDGRPVQKPEQKRERRELSQISVKDTIGDVPGLWVNDYRSRLNLLDVFKLSKLPDIEDVETDVDDISRKLKQLEMNRVADVDVEFIKRDVADIVNDLERLEKGASKDPTQHSGNELISLSREVKRMVSRIDRIETRKERATARSALPDLKELRSDIDEIDNVSVRSLDEGTKKEEPAPMRDLTRVSTGSIQEAEEVPETVDVRLMLRRSVPFIFLAVALLGYLLVSTRVIFSLSIPRIMPLSIDPMHVFWVLLIILVITAIANYFRRIKINKAMRSDSPVWQNGGGDQ